MSFLCGRGHIAILRFLGANAASYLLLGVEGFECKCKGHGRGLGGVIEDNNDGSIDKPD
jgi:hypothetical protein